MKTTAKIILIMVLAAAIGAARVSAQLITYDPTIFTQNAVNFIESYALSKLQMNSLAGILGINTQQLNTMNGVLNSMGTAGNLSNFPTGISQQQLLNMIQVQVGGTTMSLSDISKFLNTNGVFDVFLGQPTSQWQQMVQSPLSYFGSTLRSDATIRIGANIGQTPLENAYTQWVGAMTPGEVTANSSNITLTASQVLLGDYYNDAQTRHDTLAAFDATITADKTNGAQATTVNQLLANANSQSRTQNELLLNLSKEQQRHQELDSTNAAAQTGLLQDQKTRDEIAASLINLDNTGDH